MRRLVLAALLAAMIAIRPLHAHAAEAESGSRIFGLTAPQLAIAVAVVVTGARVAFVAIAGGTVFGVNVGNAVLAVYLAHVVAEGVIYGAGAGTSAYLLSGGKRESDPDAEPSPHILPDRLGNPRSLPINPSLEMAQPRQP